MNSVCLAMVLSARRPHFYHIAIPPCLRCSRPLTVPVALTTFSASLPPAPPDPADFQHNGSRPRHGSDSGDGQVRHGTRNPRVACPAEPEGLNADKSDARWYEELLHPLRRCCGG